MKSKRKTISNGTWLLTICLLLAAIGLSSCRGGLTVTPREVRDTVASFDGNAQNSGFLGYTPEGIGVITPHARERYNDATQLYGDRFTPKLVRDAGLTPFTNGTWLIDNEHDVKAREMFRWQRGSQ